MCLWEDEEALSANTCMCFSAETYIIVMCRRSIGSSERPNKSPRSENLTAGTPVGAASGFPSPWQTASPTLLMSTPSARMSR